MLPGLRPNTLDQDRKHNFRLETSHSLRALTSPPSHLLSFLTFVTLSSDLAEVRCGLPPTVRSRFLCYAAYCSSVAEVLSDALAEVHASVARPSHEHQFVVGVALGAEVLGLTDHVLRRVCTHAHAGEKTWSDQGPDLQNILRQSYDYLTIMPRLRSTYDGHLIYKTAYNEWKAFHG